MPPIRCSNDDDNSAILVLTNLGNGEVTSLCGACVPNFFVEMARQMPGVRVIVDQTARDAARAAGEAEETHEAAGEPEEAHKAPTAARSKAGRGSRKSSAQPTATAEGEGDEAQTEPTGTGE